MTKKNFIKLLDKWERLYFRRKRKGRKPRSKPDPILVIIARINRKKNLKKERSKGKLKRLWRRYKQYILYKYKRKAIKSKVIPFEITLKSMILESIDNLNKRYSKDAIEKHYTIIKGLIKKTHKELKYDLKMNRGYLYVINKILTGLAENTLIPGYPGLNQLILMIIVYLYVFLLWLVVHLIIFTIQYAYKLIIFIAKYM